MPLITIPEPAATRYCDWLDAYERDTRCKPGPAQRTEAYFCARSSNPWARPAWID